MACREYGEAENYELELIGVEAVDGGEVPMAEVAAFEAGSVKTLELQEQHSTYLKPRIRHERDGSLEFQIVFDAGEGL